MNKELEIRRRDFSAGWDACIDGRPSNVLHGYDQFCGWEAAQQASDKSHTARDAAAGAHVRRTSVMNSRELPVTEDGNILFV